MGVDVAGISELSSSTTSGAPRRPDKTMQVVNPATEEVIAEVAAANASDVDAAVAAARAALAGPWSAMSARERGRLVRKLGDRLMERADHVARLETLHNGKPITESRQIEIPAAAECFEYYGGWSDKLMGETIPVKGNHLTYTLREPVGVVAAIVPWNFPLLLAAWKVAPALACGNTVILKPASQTPLTALALGEIAVEVGLPAGRAERHHRSGIDGRPGDCGASGDRQGRLHRRYRHREVDHEERRRHAQEDHAGARRKIPQHRAAGRRHGGRGPRRHHRHLLRQGGGLRRRLQAAGRPFHQGRVSRQARGPGEEDGAWRPDGSQDSLRRDLFEEAARHRARLHRIGEARRGDAHGRRSTRRHRHRQGLFRPADRLRRRQVRR